MYNTNIYIYIFVLFSLYSLPLHICMHVYSCMYIYACVCMHACKHINPTSYASLVEF